MKTLVLEELAPEAQQIMESWLTKKAPINLAREGHLRAELFDADEAISLEITPEEEEELLKIFDKAKANFAAGKFITLDQFKAKHADKFRGGNQ